MAETNELWKHGRNKINYLVRKLTYQNYVIANAHISGIFANSNMQLLSGCKATWNHYRMETNATVPDALLIAIVPFGTCSIA